jgi:hypothetical protein
MSFIKYIADESHYKEVLSLARMSETWYLTRQVIVAVLTALTTTLGVTSCM